MLKKTIKYTDYDGVERTEDFYFNLSKAEVMEMEYGTTGGLTKMIEQMVNTQDVSRIMELFKRIIVASYGEKSLDGKRFVKSPELATQFTQTEAYSELFMELLKDPQKFADFINAIIPTVPGMEQATAEAMAKLEART